MSGGAEDAKPPPRTWQPLTFGGVAACARARVGPLLAAQLAAAMMVGACAVWFFHRAYCPVILQAIQKMPETARVAEGQLQGVPETLVSESRFLAIVVAPRLGGDIGQDADVQIQLRQTDFCAGTIFRPDWGWAMPYGKGAAGGLGRSNLEPWWGAWEPMLLAAAGAAVVVMMLVLWAVPALVYTAPARFIAWFADRQLSWSGAWRLASAAMLPGTLVVAGAIILYGCAVADLVGLSFFAAVQMIIGWVYLIGGACKAPRLYSDDLKRNPFTV
jgi:hypothetical protein